MLLSVAQTIADLVASLRSMPSSQVCFLDANLPPLIALVRLEAKERAPVMLEVPASFSGIAVSQTECRFVFFLSL